MKDQIIFMILLQVILIILNAVFACAEIAVISMNDNKIAKLVTEGDRRAIRLEKLTNQPARFLATIQIAITLSGFLGSAFAAENFSDILVNGLISLGVPVPRNILDSMAVVLITVILSYFTLVFGEIVPKQIAMRKAEKLALMLSGILSAIAWVCAPVVSFLTVSTNGVLRLFGIDPHKEEESASEEEIRMLVDAGSEKGTIDYEEKEFIQNVFEFDDLSAEEILTHRTDVVMLDLEDDIEKWREVIHGSRHTLYPVCNGTADHIVGILNSKDYFRLEEKTLDQVMKKAVRPAYFVLDTVKADKLFRNMKKDKQYFAVVVDEYGGMSGIITINDLIERLVGELVDEDEEEILPIMKLNENTWEIQGSALLEEVSKELKVDLPCEEYDTFSGFILHNTERIPEDGSVIETKIEDLVISSAIVKEHQVESAIVKLVEQEKI